MRAPNMKRIKYTKEEKAESLRLIREEQKRIEEIEFNSLSLEVQARILKDKEDIENFRAKKESEKQEKMKWKNMPIEEKEKIREAQRREEWENKKKKRNYTDEQLGQKRIAARERYYANREEILEKQKERREWKRENNM